MSNGAVPARTVLAIASEGRRVLESMVACEGDLNATLDALCLGVAEVLQASVGVWLVSDDRASIVVRSAAHWRDGMEPLRSTLGVSLALDQALPSMADAVSQGRSFLISTPFDDADRSRVPSEHLANDVVADMHSMLFVPLAFRNEVFGVLALGRETGQAAFDDLTQMLVETLAVGAAPWVSNALLLQGRKRDHAVIESVGDAVVALDVAGRISGWNPAAERLTGVSTEMAIGKEFADLVDVRAVDGSRVLSVVRRALEQRGRWAGNLRIDSDSVPGGKPAMVAATAVALIDGADDATGEVWVLRTIAVEPPVDDPWRRELEDQLAHKSTHDSLTGLPNRALLADRLSLAIFPGRGTSGQVGVLFCDLDGFKDINDTFGHDVGDTALRHVTARLIEACRDGDTVARFGGDEFVVVCEGLVDAEHAQAIAARIVEVISRPLSDGALDLQLGACVGIAVYDRADGKPAREQASQLLRDADTALSRAKQIGPGTITVYSWDLREAVVERLTINRSVVDALSDGQFVLHHQPVLRVRDGRIIGAEALVRWQHPDRGLLLPAAFLQPILNGPHAHVFERTMIRSAVSAAARWYAARELGVTVGVNVGESTICDPTLPDYIAGLLEEFRVPGSNLVVELTETGLIDDPVKAKGVLDSLNALGVRLALDDFGTGFSSLTHLHRFPVSIVKVDRSFVSELATDQDSRTLVGGLTKVAHDLGMEVLAEGVETLAQRQVVEDLGVDYFQGWLVSPAVDVLAFTAMLAVAEGTSPVWVDLTSLGR